MNQISNEEYIKLIETLLKRIGSNTLLERIYNFVNHCYVGRGN